jgi:hypothetical protein
MGKNRKYISNVIRDVTTSESDRLRNYKDHHIDACPKITNIRGFIAFLLYASNYYVCVNKNDASTNTMPLSTEYMRTQRETQGHTLTKSLRPT